jgi:hypothetical protein
MNHQKNCAFQPLQAGSAGKTDATRHRVNRTRVCIIEVTLREAPFPLHPLSTCITGKENKLTAPTEIPFFLFRENTKGPVAIWIATGPL